MTGHNRAELHGGTVDSDEYKDDEQDQEVEYEEEDQEQEDPQPTKEQLEYLKLREKLKEKVRQQMRKENNYALGLPQEQQRESSYDNFGSFFGPSQPVIARRVIEEATAKLEAQHIAAKVSKPHYGNGKALASRTAETKSSEPQQRLKKVDEVKLKLQKLKENRDFSFLLSKDAELPAPSKEPGPRNVSVPKSDAQSIKLPSNSKPSTSKPSRPFSDAHKNKGSVNPNRQVQRKVGAPKMAPTCRPISSSADPRKLLSSHGGSGPGRPKGSFSKVPAPVMGQTKASVTGVNSADPSVQKAPSVMDKKKPSATGVNSAGPSVQTAPSLKRPSLFQKQSAEQRRQPQGLDKPAAKMVLKQLAPLPKCQSEPPKRIPAHALHGDHQKKRPIKTYPDEDAEGGGDISSMIRQMFGYDPSKYRGMDDDDSDMEVGFSRIQAEERRSARIAHEEDERERIFLEEEERRERERQKRKKLKQKHNQQ